MRCGSAAGAVVYGRRRIGKSSLIGKALQGKKALFFDGLENRPKQVQITNFLSQLARQTGVPYTGSPIRTWADAFVYLSGYVRKELHHICLDEFQWMANYRGEAVSELKMAWDGYFSELRGLTWIFGNRLYLGTLFQPPR